MTLEAKIASRRRSRKPDNSDGYLNLKQSTSEPSVLDRPDPPAHPEHLLRHEPSFLRILSYLRSLMPVGQYQEQLSFSPQDTSAIDQLLAAHLPHISTESSAQIT